MHLFLINFCALTPFSWVYTGNFFLENSTTEAVVFKQNCNSYSLLLVNGVLKQKKRNFDDIHNIIFSITYCFCLLILVARKHEAMVSLVKEKSTLRGHVIMPLHVDSELDCALMCLNTRTCFSFNYKTNIQLCELNHTNKFTSPNDFISDLDSTYYEMVFT